MPFHCQPAYMDFTNDDIAYGLAQPRSDFMKWCFAQGWFMRTGDLQFPKLPTVDVHRKEKGESIGPDKMKKLWQFWTEMEKHDKYKRYMQQLLRTGSMVESDLKTQLHLSDVEENNVLRAKSKFGLEYTIKSLNGHVHFVLDGLNMSEVATKTYVEMDSPRGPSNGDADKVRSITGAELRWVYRHRKAPRVQERVQFWCRAPGTNDFVAVGPPWEDTTRMTHRPRDASGVASAQPQVTWKVAWTFYKPKKEHAQLA